MKVVEQRHWPLLSRQALLDDRPVNVGQSALDAVVITRQLLVVEVRKNARMLVIVAERPVGGQ
jgi:hypothetical protein